jgi:hypothetical protein
MPLNGRTAVKKWIRLSYRFYIDALCHWGWRKSYGQARFGNSNSLTAQMRDRQRQALKIPELANCFQ